MRLLCTAPKVPWSLLKIAPLLLLILFIGIAPVGSAFYNAFFHDFYGERSFAGWDNFKFIFKDQGFSYSLRITVLWAVSNTLLSLLLGFIFAVTLVKKTHFSSLFYFILLIPWGIPVYIAVPLWRALLHGQGGLSLLTTISGIHLNLLTDPIAGFSAALLVSAWMTAPLTAFVFLGAIKKIPKNTIEAARIDGATDAHLALSFYLPCIRETMLVMGVLNFIKAFKEFTVIFLMTSGGPPLKSGFTAHHIIGATTTLEIFLFEVFSSSDDFGIPAAFAVITAGMVIIIMAIWYLIKKKGNRKIVLFFSAVSQIILGRPLGWLWASGYLASLKWRILLYYTVAFQIIGDCMRMIRKGFLAGFNPGLILALFCLYIFKPKKSKPGSLKKILNPIWKWASPLAPAVMIGSSLLLLYLVVWVSLSKVNAVYVDSTLPQFLTLMNFKKIVLEEQIFKYFLNTFIVSVLTGLFIPLLTFPAASYLTQRSVSFSTGFLTFVQIIGITGGMHSLIPLYAIFRSLGMLNSYSPLILIYLSHTVPFSLFTIKAYLDHIPKSLRENATLEGMHPISYMLKVLLPLSLPVISTSVMVAFVNAWNGFLVPLLFLNDDSKYTISVKLYSLIGSIASGNPKWNLFAAASIVNIALLSMIFLRFKRPLQHTALFEFED